MIKVVQITVLYLGMVSFLNFSFAQHNHEGHTGHEVSRIPAQQMQTVEGEVLDMVCFMAHEGKGKKHKDCAQKCINEGAAVGLLTSEGKVYLVIENHHKKEGYQTVKKLAAEKVKITGPVYTKDGIQAIEAESVEKL